MTCATGPGGGSRLSGKPFGYRSEGHKRPGGDEVTDHGVRAQVAPAQDAADEPHTMRVPATEVDGDGQALVVGEEPVLGVNNLRPIWTRSAGRARMLRIQSEVAPQPEQMTTSLIEGS